MKHTLLALALAAAPLAAQAVDTDSGLSYTYVEGGYSQIRGEAEDPIGGTRTLTLDGLRVAGSVAVAPEYHVFASYGRHTFDDYGIDQDFDEWHLGGGYNHAIAPSIDLLARVSLDRYEAGLDDHYNALGIEAGVRGGFNASFEAFALLGYQHYDSSGRDYHAGDRGDFYTRLGAQVKFNPIWGAGTEVKMFENGDTQWFVGPRASF